MLKLFKMIHKLISNYDEMLLVRYLKLLGLQKKKPCMEALKEIIAAHITKVPFENISKLLSQKEIKSY